MKTIVKEFYIYTLTDARGVSYVKVVDDSSDNMTIGGYDKEGKYQQFDSYEAYHAYGWAEKHGFKLVSETRSIAVEIPEPRQYCWKCDSTHAVDYDCQQGEQP